MCVDLSFSTGSSHHWECNDTVRQKVVIQAGQVGSSTSDESQCGLDIEAQSITAFDAAQNLFVFLDENLLVCCVMLNYRSRTANGGKSRNIIERGIVVQRRRIGACQEALVN